MIRFRLQQNKNEKSSAYGKWYAFPVVEETMGCIKEQLLAGKNVKIADLAIFSVGLRNSCGAATEADFTVSGNIAGVKLRARATGILSTTNLNMAATVRKANVITTSSSGSSSDNSGSTGGGGDASDPL